ncbi:carbon-nitrogen hydrolase family protein [Paenibacillus frigoriresistens]|uniref:carbon-nitrogen hydrolase family protein n=1 Tax=Paenibacillus alginolyticus TaxID=59839 RepID=UPI0015666F19|nr:carbon-nitrogen hydrolase family protein [Paenibacillus frigoriresistens]NRF96316.1 carbon-nitrogen hydrolase family protein [Paenibacillus frigoriresistens]
MKIAVAQIMPQKGNILENIEKHKALISLAVSGQASAIFFPELSITGYEPELAMDLATDQYDHRFDDFQHISDKNHITIGIGVPTKSISGILISMIIFQPNQPRQTYSKQKLHADEFPYFVGGNEQIVLTLDGTKVAPAICYESLQIEHAEQANNLGADIYLASVAKSRNGVGKAMSHYPHIANTYSMTVLMTNCIGLCDNFESVGQTAVWNNHGHLVGQLNDTNEGIIIYDLTTKSLIKKQYLDVSDC